MTFLISGILVWMNLISSVLKGKGLILKVLLLATMWVLFWGNYNNADYLNYKQLYDFISHTGTWYETSQVGLSQIMKLVSSVGLGYHHFLMIVSFLGIYLIASTVEKYTSKPQLVYLLYFIYPFLLDIVQVGHFFAMSIIIYCLRYIEKDGMNNNIKFVLGVLIASSIHYISLFFLPLVLINKMKIKQIYIIIYIALMVGIPLAYTNAFQIIASYIVPFQNVEIYFVDRARYGFVLQFFIQGVILLIVYCSKIFLDKRKNNNQFVELIFKTNVYLLILFPLYIINGTFNRAFRMIMIPNYIVLSMVLFQSTKREKILILTLLLVMTIILFVYYIYIPSSHTVFLPIFENNLLFN